MDLAGAEALRLSGRLAEAEAACDELLLAEPNDAAALHLAGVVADGRGRAAEARLLLVRAVGLSPGTAAYRRDLGLSYAHGGENEAALSELAEAVRLDPAQAVAHDTAGVVLQRAGRTEEAMAAYRRAFAADPGYGPAHQHLGHALWVARRLDEAVDVFRGGLARWPRDGDLWRGLLAAYAEQGRTADAIDCYRRVVALPGATEADLSNLMFTLHYDPRATADELFAAARAYGARVATGIPPLPRSPENDRSPERRLRVGYVTSDFREHPIGRLVEPVLAGHDRAAVEVYCYSDVAAAHADGMTAHLRGLADAWRDTADQSHAELAERVRADRVDVLVELNGHFGNNRLPMLARRAAPVQVSHFGYCDTTGTAGVDYRVTDALSDPPGTTERYHTERLARIPGASWCYRPWGTTPAVGPLPALSRGYVTFGNLNNAVKTSDPAAAAWAAVLAAVAGARLLLLTPKGAEGYVVRRFAALGTDPGRLVLVNPLPRHAYLAMYNQMDVALDPFPFNGDNTTCDAMWMGVPSVALAGRSFCSRRGVSHLTNVGLGALVADTVERYVSTAASLAADLPRLADLRRGMRRRLQASPVGDAGAFVPKLEAAYREMWRAWCRTGPLGGMMPRHRPRPQRRA